VAVHSAGDFCLGEWYKTSLCRLISPDMLCRELEAEQICWNALCMLAAAHLTHKAALSWAGSAGCMGANQPAEE